MPTSTEPPAKRKAASTETAFVAIIGGMLGIFGQHMPWGNGFIAIGMFFGAIVSAIFFSWLLRRETALRRWSRSAVSLLITAAVVAIVGFLSSRPEPVSTLTYMLNGKVPSGVQIEFVRRQWFDGEVYVARFSADDSAIAAIRTFRPYQEDINATADESLPIYRTSFLVAGLLFPAWQRLPALKAPHLYEWQSSINSPPGKVEGATLLWDADSHECWLMYSWT